MKQEKIVWNIQHSDCSYIFIYKLMERNLFLYARVYVNLFKVQEKALKNIIIINAKYIDWFISWF